jgi:hypothetical protein
MTDNIFKSLGGKRTGKNKWLVRCPCPNHGKGKGDRNPSLSVSIGTNGKPLFYCFAGCGYDDITASLQAKGLQLDDKPNFRERPRWKKPVIVEIENPNPEPNPDAVTLWNNSIEDSGMLIEYLARRGLLTLPRSIRWLSATCKMIAAVQRPSDGKLIQVQTTPIGPDATRAGERMTTSGKLGAGAVRLAKAAPVMGICEGVETGLAAQTIFKMPVWTSLGSSRLHKIELPSEVREVHIFGDNDKPGRLAADKAAEAHHKLGRKAILHFPAGDLNDWNDVLLADADTDYLPDDGVGA